MWDVCILMYFKAPQKNTKLLVSSFSPSNNFCGSDNIQVMTSAVDVLTDQPEIVYTLL